MLEMVATSNSSNTIMAALPTHQEMMQRLNDYSSFDRGRQEDIQFFIRKCIELNELRVTLESDLEDERDTKRAHKRRADQLETAAARKFVVVLIDGDGYYFRKHFFDALDMDGSKAASELYNQIIQNVRDSGDLTADCDVLVNFYANKYGLARTLTRAGYLGQPQQLDQFFCSFTRGRSLFQFIDVGSGKERVDAKLRGLSPISKSVKVVANKLTDTFRFYAYNAQCQRVYLACTHDSGYVAEFDKYSHDPIKDKIMLVHGWQTPATARSYNLLPFKSTNFNDVFECSPLDMSPEMNATYGTPAIENLSLNNTSENGHTDLSRTMTTSSASSRSLPLNPTAQAFAKTTTTPPPISGEAPHTGPVSKAHTAKSGIPVNKSGQRVDLKIAAPSSAVQKKLDERIARQKLCNEHHLRNTCMATACRFDHYPMEPAMLDALRVKARSIACTQGSKCRRLDCYYGHQCPVSALSVITLY